MLSRPVCARTSAISSRCSDACVCTSRPCSADSAGRGFEQIARARDREARRERRAQPAVGRAVPALRAAPALSSSPAARWLVQPRGRLAAHVHQALADDGAQSGRHQRLEHRVGAVHRLHRQHAASCRRAAARPPPAAPPRASVRVVVRRFERPDALAQPGEQRQVVGQPAEQRLAEMDVRLHEAGQHDARRRRRSSSRARDVRRRPRRPRRCGRRRSRRRPSTTSHASFIVRIVALRMRSPAAIGG